KNSCYFFSKKSWRQREINKPRTSNLYVCDERSRVLPLAKGEVPVRAEGVLVNLINNFFSKFARVLPRLLGQNHRHICCKITMRQICWVFQHNSFWCINVQH